MADSGKLHGTRLLQMHGAVVRRDPTALDQVWAEVRPALCRRLRRQCRLAPTDLIADAATDAILAYFARPHVYDSARQVPLDAFLFGIGARMLRDRLRAERRRAVRESDYATRRQACESRTDDRATSHLLIQEIRFALTRVCNRVELAAMEAYLKDADTVVVAACLGLSRLPDVEQKRAARRLWDAVIKRIRRRLVEANGARSSHGDNVNGQRRRSFFGG